MNKLGNFLEQSCFVGSQNFASFSKIAWTSLVSKHPHLWWLSKWPFLLTFLLSRLGLRIIIQFKQVLQMTSNTWI